MKELIKAGYVYIAKPPLYKLKQGSRERYIEKDAELEEILLSDRWDKIEVVDRNGDTLQAHRSALAALHAAAQAVRGLVSRRCAPRQWSRRRPSSWRSLRRSPSRSPGGRPSCSAARALRASTAIPHSTELNRAASESELARPRRSKPRPASRAGTASSAALFESREYRELARVHAPARGARRRARRSRSCLGDVTETRRLVSRRCISAVMGGRPEGHQTAALQGPRRDERGAARRNHDGAGDAHAGRR